MKKLNILITGARGFIGKNLVEYLASEHSGKYNLFFPFHKELDLLDIKAVEKYIKDNSIEGVVHAASVGGTRKTAYDSGLTDIVSRNLKMFFNLERHLPRIKQFISLGSGAEYDKAHYVPRMSEDYFDKHIPSDDYGFSKYAISKHIEQSNKMVNLRLFGVFGKYEDYEFKFISNSIVKNLLGLPITINQNVNFDYLNVDDCVMIIEKFLSIDPRHKAYNIVTGTTIDLVTIANKINNISGNKSKIIVKNSGLNVEYSGDNKRLLEEINFKFTPFDVALKKLYNYYRSIIGTIDKKKIETDEYIKFCKTNK